MNDIVLSDSVSQRHIIPSVTLAIEALSILLNLFVIASVIVICKTNIDRLPANHMIAALAVTDILYVCVPAGFSMPSLWQTHWYGGRVTCVLYQLFTDWLLLCSQFLITCLIIDRFLSLRHVIHFQNQSDDLSRTRGVIVACYGASLGLTLLASLGFAADPYLNETSTCLSWLTAIPQRGVREQRVYPALMILIALITTLISAVIIIKSVSYTRAIHVIYQCIKTDKTPGEDATPGDFRDNQNQSGLVQYSTMVIVLAGLQFALRLPYFVSII